MAVYVDDWRQRAELGPVTSRWSHLIADGEEELHRFAERLGLRRAWFQSDHRHPHRGHYDVPEHVRRRAIELGAEAVTWRQLGALLRARRGIVDRPTGTGADGAAGTGAAGATPS